MFESKQKASILSINYEFEKTRGFVSKDSDTAVSRLAKQNFGHLSLFASAERVKR